ncbi:MAG: periplasmic heavy metal sensor [Desulfobulbaceae bacterium]|nr:periplasmic heavy metal sensor [Desulfobulbaceae bacterium]
MKKTMMAVAAVALLGLGMVGLAVAGPGWHRGGYGMMGGGGCDGPGYYGQGGAQVDPKKQEAFLKDTEPLRREMAVTRGEYQALMEQENPDPKKAGELHARMFDLRNKIHDKAKAAGIEGGLGRGPGVARGPANCPNWN